MVEVVKKLPLILVELIFDESIFELIILALYPDLLILPLLTCKGLFNEYKAFVISFTIS